MKKLKMARGVTLTFEEGCNKYLENCRQRNLREGMQGKPFRRKAFPPFLRPFCTAKPAAQRQSEASARNTLFQKLLIKAWIKSI